MASCTTGHCCLLLALVLLSSVAGGQLVTSFYASTCPALEDIVSSTVGQAVAADRRMGASLVRLFFHDCFVQGCDASILLDDVPGVIESEKNAGPNVNSVRGYDVIDTIKTNVEAKCSGVVSCADIVALAARDGVVQLGGPSWDVPLGRRDSTTASLSLANSDLPSPSSDLAALIAAFGNKGLSPRDMTALSGAHTIGFAQCQNFRGHIYGDSDIDPAFAVELQGTCSSAASDATNSNLEPLDAQTPLAFDNAFYRNLLARRGLLHSDQELLHGGSFQNALLVLIYSANSGLFFADFADAMVKLGSISPFTGTDGEIRAKCRVVNSG